MKITKTFFFILICAVILAPICCHASNWSLVRGKNNQPPSIDPNFNFLDKYDSFYIDKKATKDNKVIYLTFDAGYENGNIERILNTLAEHNAKGAFFVLDNLIIRNTDLIKRMAEEGHYVCNHTASHKDMTKINSISEFKAELDKLENIYKEYTGLEMKKYYRPPEGKFNEENLKFAQELGYKTIFWSFAYADWDNNKQPSEEYAIKKITENTHNGMVVLLHPTSKTNADILDKVMTIWENDGYRFGTLDELTCIN